MESCVVEMRGGQIGTVSAPSRFEPESIRPAIRPGCESPVTRRIEITQISYPEWSTRKERVLRSFVVIAVLPRGLRSCCRSGSPADPS